jgi:type IV pilus assembly protein PilC
LPVAREGYLAIFWQLATNNWQLITMSTFAYTARDSSGQPTNGSLAAASVAEAIKLIRAEGKYPVSVRPADQAPRGGERVRAPRGVKISRGEVIHFSTQLAIMVETGVPLSEALECIAKQVEKPNVRALMADLSEQLQSGVAFSAALARHPRSFPQLFVSLIKASEQTGMLSQLLRRANDYLRDEQEILRRVRGALTYPGIMLGFAVSTTIFLLACVLPRFTMMYASKKAALPLPTKILMDMSSFVVHQWPLLIGGTVAAVVLGYFYFSTASGRQLWHYVQLHAPLLGKLYRKIHLSRGLRMVGTMAGAGVGLMDCVTTAHDLCGNTYFKDLWKRIADQIQTGRQLSEPLFESSLVPRSVSQMIYSGEKGGKLAMVMEQVANFSEQELKEQILQLTRYIEPLMIVAMGLIIGGVSLAMLLPIFTIGRVVAGR